MANRGLRKAHAGTGQPRKEQRSRHPSLTEDYKHFPNTILGQIQNFSISSGDLKQ